MKILYILVLACLLTEWCQSVDIDGTCANDAACTVSNSECVKDYTNCDNGKCKCKSGYTSNTGKTSCLKDTALDTTCSSTTFCLYGAECNSGTNKCACPSGKTYNSLLKLCITNNIKAISEECTDATDCYANDGGMVECVVKSGSSSTTKYCTCKAGHITENNMCRKPRVTEDCTTAIGCAAHLTLSSGQETETCESNKCTCPSTSDKLTRKSKDTTYTLCLTKFSTKKSAGDTCTTNNQCSSTYCDSCPGGTDKKCLSPVVNEDSSAMVVKGSLVILLLRIFVTDYLI